MKTESLIYDYYVRFCISLILVFLIQLTTPHMEMYLLLCYCDPWSPLPEFKLSLLSSQLL